MRLLALSLILFAAAPALAAPPPEHLEIEAASTTYDGAAHLYRVKGKVRITLPQLVVTCDAATLHFTPKEDAIQRIVFEGDVTAKKVTDTFRAKRITYDVPARRLVAEGGTRTRLQLPLGVPASAKPGMIR